MIRDGIRKQWLRVRTSAGASGVHLIAILTALMGVVNVLSSLMPAMAKRLTLLSLDLPLEVRHGSHLAATLAGFALLFLAANLWRRKQTAWLLTLIALFVSAVSSILGKLDFPVAGLALGLGASLLGMRPQFHARSDPPSIRNAALVTLAALGFTLAYGAIGFYLLDRHIGMKFDLPGSLRQTVIMFTQFSDTGLQPVTGFGRYFINSIYIVAAAALGYSLLLIGQPVLVRQPATPVERAHARAIVEQFGASSLARFTLFDDKSYFFSSGGSSIAFALKGRVALALGDPIGPADDFPSALKSFRAYCEHNDWSPAFYQTPPGTLEMYKAAGFNVMSIGQEAIVDLAGFTTEGKAGRELRSTDHRLTNLGLRVEPHLPPLGRDLVNALRAVSDAWLTMMHGTELRFGTGWFDDDYIQQSTVLAVHRPDGGVSAFANLVPEYRLNETAVDLMRHVPSTERGTMDFLFLALLTWAKASGFATFSLGLSALSGVGEHSTAPRTERALHYIYENVGRFYNFKGLHAYKEKFHPNWEPRYLIYPEAASLPAIATALVRANSGDNFLWTYFRS